MEKLRAPVMVALLASGALLTRALAAQPVFADHESRDRVLSESGVEVILIVLVLVAAVGLMVAFAGAILWWERQDGDTPDSEQSN